MISARKSLRALPAFLLGAADCVFAGPLRNGIAPGTGCGAASFPEMARILLVEDYDLVRNILFDAIIETGHSAQCCTTKEEAEASLAAGPYDLVICNIRLPDGSGVDIAAKAADHGIRTVLMTGHPDEIQALLISGIAHLKKPFRLEEFVQLIEDRLGAKRD